MVRRKFIKSCLKNEYKHKSFLAKLAVLCSAFCLLSLCFVIVGRPSLSTIDTHGSNFSWFDCAKIFSQTRSDVDKTGLA